MRFVFSKLFYALLAVGLVPISLSWNRPLLRWLALACARLGRTNEALKALRDLLRVAPQFRIGMLRRVRFADAKLLETDLALLRTARIPE